MSKRGSITLGEMHGRLDLLDIACHRCERRGRVSLSRLIEEHGADTGLPDLWESSPVIAQRAVNSVEQSLRHLLSAIAGAVSNGQGKLTPGAAVTLCRMPPA